MLAALTHRVEHVQHPFFAARPVKTRGILLITTDRGLCGPLNSNLLRVVTEIKEPAKYVCIGRKGTQFLGRTKRDIVSDFTVTDKTPFAEVRPAAEYLIKLFLEGEVDTVEVLFSYYRNTLIQVPLLLPLLPLVNLEASIERVRKQKGAGESAVKDDEREMLFEPSPSAVFESLLPLFLNREMYQCVLDAKASEHSARMVAMKTAKDNASKLLDALTLQFNKARQAAITAEILEISAAQMAQAV